MARPTTNCARLSTAIATLRLATRRQQAATPNYPANIRLVGEYRRLIIYSVLAPQQDIHRSSFARPGLAASRMIPLTPSAATAYRLMLLKRDQREALGDRCLRRRFGPKCGLAAQGKGVRCRFQKRHRAKPALGRFSGMAGVRTRRVFGNCLRRLERRCECHVAKDIRHVRLHNILASLDRCVDANYSAKLAAIGCAAANCGG